MNKFGRVLLPFVTPFDEKEDVNYEAFAELIEYAIKKDFLDTVIVTGTTGEFNTLSFEERVKLYKTAVKAVDGRCPIIAGTGAASTRESVALTNAAVKAGINTCMIVGPYYCKPTQQAIYEHYMRIMNETEADLLIYNIPIFTGTNIEPATVRKLAQASKRFVGIKDESGVNPIQITEYYFATHDINPDFLIFNGDDIMLMPTLAQGADGIVSGGALLLGDRIKQTFETYYGGKVEDSLEYYRDLVKICKLNGINGRVHPNPMLRAAVELVSGIKIGKPRMPLDSISESERAEMMKVLKELKLI
jgi:4-hydroxy-tetrahydrodipicolinate synthase